MGEFRWPLLDACLSSAAAPLAAAAQRAVSSNDRIQFGAIDLEGRGTADVHVARESGKSAGGGFRPLRATRIRARGVFGKDVFVTADYCQLLARKDVDAAIGPMPDHASKGSSVVLATKCSQWMVESEASSGMDLRKPLSSLSTFRSHRAAIPYGKFSRCWPTPANSSGRAAAGIRRAWSAYEIRTD